MASGFLHHKQMIYGMALGLVFSILSLCQAAELPSLIFAVSFGLTGTLIASLWMMYRGTGDFCGFLILGIGLGLCLGTWDATQELALKVPSDIDEKPRVLTGQIISLPQSFPEGPSTRFVFEVGKRHLQVTATHCLSAIRLGETWQLPLKIKAVKSLLNPGGFDAEANAFQKKIHGRAQVFCRWAREIQKISGASPFSIAYIRQKVADEWDDWGKKSEVRGILKALVLGDQTAIKPGQWAIFRATGTNHLVAISGLHIGLLFGWVFFSVRWFGRRFFLGKIAGDPENWASCLGALAALFYAQLAGTTLPTQRAVWMISLALVARFFGWKMDRWVIWTQAFLILLISDPFSVLSPGFWLSFAAVAAIFYTEMGRLGQITWWRSAARSAFWVSLMLVPIGLFWFQQVSWVSPITNFVAIPWMSGGVVPFLLWSMVVGMLSPSMGWCLWFLAEHSLKAEVQCLQWFAERVPIGTAVVAPEALLFLILAIALWRWPGLPARYLTGLYCLPLFHHAPLHPSWGGAWVQVLDVGQGLSVVIQTAHHVLIYDTGMSWGKTDMGGQVILPYLQSHGIKNVDLILLSHEDNDHAGGFDTLHAAFPHAAHWSYPGMNRYGTHGLCVAPRNWQWDGIRFAILHPSLTDRFQKNNASCVLQVEWPAMGNQAPFRLLLPGDIEHKAERLLVQRQGFRLQSDVLVVPHHGSRTSSGLVFLDQVRPKWAIVSAGYRNRFHLPKPEILTRYRQAGTTVWNTAETGGVGLRIDPGKAPVFERMRVDSKRFWMD